MSKTVRIAVDASAVREITNAHARSLQLKEWIDGAEKERKELAEKMDVYMQEHGANQLLIDGKVAARIDEYDTESMPKAACERLSVKHPRIWNAFRVLGHVRKVVVLS